MNMSLDDSLKKAIDDFMVELNSIDQWNSLSQEYQQKIKNFCGVHHLEICAFILLLNLYFKNSGASGFNSALVLDNIDDLSKVIDKYFGK